jgi:hypothetical protein
MQNLSTKLAQACEEATQPQCKCRCGGVLHGAKRGGTNTDGSIDRAFFERLPQDDPHYLPSEEVKQRRAKQKKIERRIATLQKRIEKEPSEYIRRWYGREVTSLRAELDRIAYEQARRGA